uniref:Homeobox domain-containing protein n=1 Tax=Panagrolaimus superbus TaxID=310955 RepID=A0A914YHV7_9BILA
MSSSVQCFPMLQAFKPTESSSNLHMSNIFSTPLATSSSTSSSSSSTLPTMAPNSANFFEKFLNSQQIDTVAYLQALSQSTALTSNFSTLSQPSSTAAAILTAATPSNQQQPSNFNHLLTNIAAIGGGCDRNVLNLNLNQQKISKRRNRTTFTHEQATALEKEYSIDQYMPRSRRAVVAENLSLTEGQVKTWFQNRRAKDKRTDKLNGIQQHNSSETPSTAAVATGSSSSTVSPTSTAHHHHHHQQRSIVSGIGSGPKPMIQKPTFDTNFLMPPLNGGIPSPSSSTTSSNFSANHSPLSPLSPLFGNNNNNNLTFGNMDANSSAATLAALYMQALQLQTSIASSIVTS